MPFVYTFLLFSFVYKSTKYKKKSEKSNSLILLTSDLSIFSLSSSLLDILQNYIPCFFLIPGGFSHTPTQHHFGKGGQLHPHNQKSERQNRNKPPLPRIKTNHLAPARNFAAGQSEIQPRLAGKLAR